MKTKENEYKASFISIIALIVLTLYAIATKAQNFNVTKNGFEGFVEFRNDLKMSFVGPYRGDPQDIGTTFDFELAIGFEYKRSRLGFTFESHEAIDYHKMAVFYDRIRRDKLLGFIEVKSFSSSYGIEFGMIRRYFEKDPDWVQYGFNFGTEYRIHLNRNDTGFSLTVNYNVFRGETAYRKFKSGYLDEFRHDVMFGLKRNF